MEEISDLLEGIMMDVLNEGIGTTAGIVLMWGMFIGGTFTAFSALMTLLAGTI